MHLLPLVADAAHVQALLHPLMHGLLGPLAHLSILHWLTPESRQCVSLSSGLVIVPADLFAMDEVMVETSSWHALLGVYLGLTGPAADLARLLDGLEDGFLLCDHSGYLLHQTPTLAQMLNDEPERKRLQGTIQGILHSLIELFSHSGERAVGTPAQVSRGIRTARASYRVYGTNVRHGITQQGLAPPGVTLVIRVEYIRPRPPSDQALQRCFGLTVREVEVARLLARCWSRGEIARYLRVSPHTVARHSEHVFTKIGVHSRAQLRARLAGEHPDKMLNQ